MNLNDRSRLEDKILAVYKLVSDEFVLNRLRLGCSWIMLRKIIRWFHRGNTQAQAQK